MFINESFLSFIWQHLYFNKKDLTTTNGESLSILQTGNLNTNAGPDFLNARICLNDMVWAGAVEIHVKSSHWDFHHHENNPNYNKVILQVVWEDDGRVSRNDRSVVPTLELKGLVTISVIEKFRNLVYDGKNTIACASQIQQVKRITLVSMIQKTLIARLERKADEVFNILKDCNNSWEEVTYRMFMKSLGSQINQYNMLLLSCFLPLSMISRYRGNLIQLEALMFGTAGFLEKIRDEYHQTLAEEYKYLKHKFEFEPGFLARYQWKFLRLHPQNFPTIRIAQAAAIINRIKNLFSMIISISSLKSTRVQLMCVQSKYWQKHYDFGKPSKKQVSGMGKNSADNVIINTFIPVLAAYSKYTDHSKYMDRAVELLEELPAENNSITRIWKKMGVFPANAFDSQGLIELSNSYCYKKRCLNCNIGADLLLEGKTKESAPG